MSDFEIEELVIPPTLDAPGGDAFVEMTAVRNRIEADAIATSELGFEAAELLPHWLDPNEPKRLFVARVDGRIVGRAVYEDLLDDTAPEAWIVVEVLPEFRGRGIGAAFYALLREMALERGRSVLQGSFEIRAEHPSDSLERIEAPTGFGSVSSEHPGSRFALARGFRLEQVERISRLPLPADLDVVSEKLRVATRFAGDDYRLVTWTGRTPDRWVDDIAIVRTRMQTDAPTAALEVTEEVWTAERVRTEDTLQEHSPRLRIVAAVEHLPTGRLAAFSELSVPAELDRPVQQGDTLALREHRGHRLGMLVKVANILHLERVRPGHPAITTFNAEENRHMLSVNEDVGFVAIGYETVWQLAI